MFESIEASALNQVEVFKVLYAFTVGEVAHRIAAGDARLLYIAPVHPLPVSVRVECQ